MILEVFADGKKISCNFIGDCAALIDMNSLKRYHRPPVVILPSFKIKVNGDKVSLQNVINIFRVSGARNCDHQWCHQHGTLNCNLNSLSQLHTTNQQVHWVVQVINLTRVKVDPTEIVGMKQAMVIL
ncbi:uncharacterized protein DS421_10g298540 [Arachis hypogaea]|nr:uncharacterized protein DS421_10g298540 [Arachis hypogaea]